MQGGGEGWSSSESRMRLIGRPAFARVVLFLESKGQLAALLGHITYRNPAGC